MSPNTELLLLASGAVVTLIVLIARFKLHPFVALIAVSLGMGAAAARSACIGRSCSSPSSWAFRSSSKSASYC
jgi:hypothetical protein